MANNTMTIITVGAGLALAAVILLARNAQGGIIDWGSFPNDGTPYYYVLFSDESGGWFNYEQLQVMQLYGVEIEEYWGPYTSQQ